MRVLVSVCHAVDFAHSRGVLHLDLKPDNVAIGRFGEVYVLDWGLAAASATRPDGSPAPPTCRGSPAPPPTWRPSSPAADGPNVGPATDVYLLGGILHTILTSSRSTGATP
ncbi:MAG: hypothetical protein R3B82_07090 [Sandaracinaceae bacterium]